MALTAPNRDLTAGVAASSAEIISPNGQPLLAGDTPALFSQSMLVAASQDLKAGTVVGLSSGALVQATLTIVAVGVLAYAVKTGASDTTTYAEVWRGGCFNKDALIWHTNYDTDAKKFAAFNGAPTPTVIIVKDIVSMTPAAPA